MEDILIGSTDRTVLVFIPDPASTTGVGKTGLNAAAVTITYTRVETDNDVVHTDVTGSVNDLTNLTDAHSDWGWKEVSSSLSKGLYRLDIADAVFASGAWSAVVQVTITSGTAAATPKAFRLVARNDLDGVRLGLTALPNAAAEAAGGLYTRGTGAGQINQNANGQVDTRTVAMSSGVIVAATFGAGAIDAAALAADAGTELGTAVWATAARTLTAATNITSTGGTITVSSGVVSANVTQIDGAATNNNTATLYLKQLNIFNDAGSAVVLDTSATANAVEITSSDGDTIYLDASGGTGINASGSVAGIQAVGGILGIGAFASNGDALLAEAGGDGDGIKAVGAGTGVDIRGAITGNITGNLSGSVGSATNLGSAAVDAILDEVIEDSQTLRELLRGFASALLAKASGLETTTAVFRDLADSKDRITATVDADGNRSAVTLDLT